jgi:hypothetical protein
MRDLQLSGLQVSCSAFHPATEVLVVGLTSGAFEIYQLPGAHEDAEQFRSGS